jgi:peptidoglycan/xylan/chitin deacetylase (PgdA/CDA1 family)
MSLPHYYSSLGPFRATFQRGDPVLTYHHVGPRPRKVRLKGLYVSPKFFDRQLRELGAAGFSSASLAVTTRGRSSAELRVFLTFDDGFRDVFDHALPVLQRQRFCGLVFLVSELVGKTNEWQQRAGDVTVPLMDEHQVRDWLAAGQQIGSHTLTHPRLTQLPVSQAKEEIVASKHALEDRFGVPVEHFCYPYGDWNPAVRDLVHAAGYKTGCTTDPGVNTPETSPYELKRFTARYPSRNLKAIWVRLRARCVPQT